MSDENTAYYRAAGKSLAAILAWQEMQIATRQKWCEFWEMHGTDGALVRASSFSTRIVGLICKTGEPKSSFPSIKKTDPHDGTEYWAPNRSKIGNQLAIDMENMELRRPGPDAGSEYIGEGRWHSPGFEKLDNDWIIIQHVKATPPPDAIPMKRSEYWALKEASKPDPD